MTIVLLMAACQAADNPMFGGVTPTPAASPTPLPTPVQRFQTTVAADGEVVLPLPPQTLSAQATGLNGTVEEVYVEVGQPVTQSDPLLKIDDADLQLALRKAIAALRLTQAQIANEEAPALAGDISEAQANLEAAQAELRRLRALPSEEAVTQAAADLRLREIELRQAQEAYDAIAFAEGVGMSPQAAELETATLNYERAQAAYEEATKPADPADIVKAQSQVTQAQNALEKLIGGLRAEAEAVNQARLDEAQIQVDEAQANLEKIYLFAPWDGVITEVNGAPGVSISTASLTLAQTTPLRFATSNFSERNLTYIDIGDEAAIYLKAYPGTPFPAVIQRIELQSTQKDGDTALFTLYLDFNHGDFSVQPGMTGRVEIKIEPPS